MHGWKKGVLLGLFSSLLWEPHAVEAAIGSKSVDPSPFTDYRVQTATTQEAAPQVEGYRYESLTTSHSQPPIDLLQLLSKAASRSAASQSVSSQPVQDTANAGVNSRRIALQEQKQVEQEQPTAAEQTAQESQSTGALASRGEVTTTYVPPARSGSSSPADSAASSQQASRTKTAQPGGAVSNEAPTLMKSSGVSSTIGNRAVTVALKYLGVPYRYGGTTPSGFDCSGFLQYVMRQVGVDIPRTTYQQLNAGTPVAKANLRPGDLLFFSCGGQATSHSGMYIGNGKFIHADLDRGIAIADLNSSYWSGVYQAAVRVQ